MAGYASNQFNRFNDYESGTIARTTEDNPDFLYPGGTFPNIYDAPNNVITPTTVQRGFIRGIYPDVLNNIAEDGKKYKDIKAPVRRCFFQFNPSLILRSVQASSTTLNPLLQNATELLQPIPGQASFEFQLLFNREREVSNRKFISDGQIKDVRELREGLDRYGSTVGDKAIRYAQEHVGDLGVFSDLYVLDSIIGQSITNDMVESISAYWNITRDLRSTTTTTKQTDEKDTDKNTNTETNIWENTDFNTSDIRQRIESVLGNSAFLSPLPVRIVFSSLFMVEGFVTASNVAFHKFNSQMIPTVCQVTLNVQALYIGFAKQKSYVTEQLTQSIKDLIRGNEEDSKALSDAKEIVYEQARLQLNYLDGVAVGFPGPQSFNDWFEQNWTANKENGNYSFYGALNGLTTQEGMYIWLGQILKNQVDTGQIIDLQPTSVELIFLNKDAMPENLKNTTLLKKSAEDGTLFESSQANWRKYEEATKNGQSPPPDLQYAGYNTANLSVYQTGEASLNVDVDKIANATRDKPYKLPWASESLSIYGVGTSRSATNYFGSSMYIVLVTTWSYRVKQNNGSTGPQSVRKASVNVVGGDNNDFVKFQEAGSFGSKKNLSV